jgi:endonuclease-3
MDALVKLPGVGRKTANVVLGHALGVPGFPVDRHVLRVSNRLGIADSDDPDRVEQQLTGALPPGLWTRASDTLILHGRRNCKPEPLCGQCAAADACPFHAQASALPSAPPRRAAAKRKPVARRSGKKAAARRR